MTNSNFSETPRILVADDERVTRMMLSHLLSQLGYEVIQANNGQECLDIYRQGQKPDMVLLDAMMPVMDGFQCCEELEKLYQQEVLQKGPEAIRTPILMITALGDDANAVDRAFSVGAIDYIAKPIEKAILKQRLKRILEANAAERALRENESKYRSLVDNLNEVIFQTDLEGNITFLNPAWLDITQYAVRQCLHQPFCNFIYPADRVIYQNHVEEIKDGKKKDCRYAVRYIRKDNSIGWIEIYMNLMYRYNNSVLGLSGSLNDISDRKAREKYLEVETSINQIFTQGLSLRVTINNILNSVCSNLNWDIGQLWMIDKQSQELTCWQSWTNPDKPHLQEFVEDSMGLKLKVGEGLSGAVGDIIDYAWIPQIQDNHLFQQREIAQCLGLCSTFIIPVTDIDQRLGTLNFYSDFVHLEDENFLQIITNLGRVLGQFIRRQQTEKELQLIGQLLSMRYQSYLVIDKKFIIEKIADGAEKFSDLPELLTPGADVRQAFPALSGLESSLLGLLEGKADNFELSNVERKNNQDGSISIYIVANRQDEGPHDRLFIFFEEVSEEQVLKKALLQKEKEAYVLLDQLSKANATMQSELDGAASYVTSLLPNPNKVEHIEIDQAFFPSIQLGGDVFDYFWLDRDHFVFYLLDVAGHGVKSALLSVSVLNVLRSQSLNNTDFYEPGSVLSGLNRVFQMNERGEDYFTIWYGVFNRQRQRLIYGSAGHPPGCILGSEEPRLLESLDVPIGMVEGIDFSQEMVEIKPGDSIYIFSDGVYEIENNPNQLWGMDNFIDYLKSIHPQSRRPCQQVLAHAQNIHWNKSLDDDFSLLRINLIE